MRAAVVCEHVAPDKITLGKDHRDPVPREARVRRVGRTVGVVSVGALDGEGRFVEAGRGTRGTNAG